MAVNHIIFNDQLPHGRRLRNFLNLVDSMFSEGNELLLLMAQMKDGGNVGQYIADKFGFGLLPGANAGTAGDVTAAQNGGSGFPRLSWSGMARRVRLLADISRPVSLGMKIETN